MTVEGTVINGVIVPDGGATLPEGARVRIELTARLTYPHPMAPYDREKELALLQERAAEVRAGVPGVSVEQAFASVDAALDRIVHESGK